MARQQPPLASRFWAKVDKHGPVPQHVPGLGECWAWTAAIRGDGYGVISVDGVVMAAHRVSWALTHGPIPTGLWVLHKCDNRTCVRPAHLFLGTRRDNTDDAIAKGRVATGARTIHGTHPERVRRGEKHHWARITADDVVQIRRRIGSGETQAAIAREYGLHQTGVRKIALRLTWKHIA
jgi:hypothetical protein